MAKQKITPEQKEIFLRNFMHMNLLLDCTPYSINGPGAHKQELIARHLAPAYRTMEQFPNPDYLPTATTVAKVVRFYNANLMPAVTTMEFLSVDLFEGRHVERITDRTTSKLLGLYDCYYFSDNYPGEIHRGVLQVFLDNGFLHANLFMSLATEEITLGIYRHVLNRFKSRVELLSAFNAYRTTLPESLKECYYCTGRVRVFDRAIMMELSNPNIPEHLMYISINKDPNQAQRIYEGALAFYFSPSIGVLGSRCCQMCIVRHPHGERPLPLDEEWLRPFLAMELTNCQRYQLTSRQQRDFLNGLRRQMSGTSIDDMK